jgi:ribosomal protein S6--L-glutamate ligase
MKTTGSRQIPGRRPACFARPKNTANMILSFHPLFAGDKNILCAGREPGVDDLAAIKKAAAVVVPQGCRRELYEMARNNCPHVFPNYDARFTYADKLGQIRLFRKTGMAHPMTRLYASVGAYHQQPGAAAPPLPLPLVFKFDWGGQGDTVFCVETRVQLDDLLTRAGRFEKTGQSGFLLQQHIESGNKTLRVVVIGQQVLSYWRIQPPGDFYVSVSKGAVIDSEAEPEQQHKAVALVRQLCRKTGINLAGLDVIFSSEHNDADPLLLEINYFFGRRGLGGSEAYYQILLEEIHAWLAGLDLNS